MILGLYREYEITGNTRIPPFYELLIVGSEAVNPFLLNTSTMRFSWKFDNVQSMLFLFLFFGCVSNTLWSIFEVYDHKKNLNFTEHDNIAFKMIRLHLKNLFVFNKERQSTFKSNVIFSILHFWNRVKIIAKVIYIFT